MASHHNAPASTTMPTENVYNTYDESIKDEDNKSSSLSKRQRLSSTDNHSGSSSTLAAAMLIPSTTATATATATTSSDSHNSVNDNDLHDSVSIVHTTSNDHHASPSSSTDDVVIHSVSSSTRSMNSSSRRSNISHGRNRGRRGRWNGTVVHNNSSRETHNNSSRYTHSNGHHPETAIVVEDTGGSSNERRRNRGVRQRPSHSNNVSESTVAPVIVVSSGDDDSSSDDSINDISLLEYFGGDVEVDYQENYSMNHSNLELLLPRNSVAMYLGIAVGMLTHFSGDHSYEDLLALSDQIGNANVGLTEDDLKKLSSSTASRANIKLFKGQDNIKEKCDGDTCVVCLEGYKSNHKVVTLSCAHIFHKNCIFKWLKKDATCPVCRENIPRSRS